MKNPLKYVPSYRFDVGRPLIPGCRAVVILPARNEEVLLPRALDALRLQSDLAGEPLDADLYEVIVLLNNCTDSTVEVAQAYGAAHPGFRLHTVSVTLGAEVAFVGTARRMLMDTAYDRLTNACDADGARLAILSTDADTMVANDWIARNLAALEAGADVVGGRIHLFREDLAALGESDPLVHRAYSLDRELQRNVAELESILDPDDADPWPRHLAHFGASLACTAEIYATVGGSPAVRQLEDIAFVDALRRCGARIRHCPETHVYTSARMDGRAQVGLSGQFRHWKADAEEGRSHLVDSAAWMIHRFRSLAELRRLHGMENLPDLQAYPVAWRERIFARHAERLPLPRFLECVDCDALLEAQFEESGEGRRAEIVKVLEELVRTLAIAREEDRRSRQVDPNQQRMPEHNTSVLQEF